MEYKKFEPYIDGRKLGTIKVNWNSYLKKHNAGDIRIVVNVTSLIGCSFGKKSNKTEIRIDTIDSEIDEKKHFVESVLNELYELENQNLINQIIPVYKKMKNIEDAINPLNEYAAFYTEEENHAKKQQMSLYLSSIINIIENSTKYQFGTDFISDKKTK